MIRFLINPANSNLQAGARCQYLSDHCDMDLHAAKVARDRDIPRGPLSMLLRY
jgi:hypothetical protein